LKGLFPEEFDLVGDEEAKELSIGLTSPGVSPGNTLAILLAI